MKNMFPKKDENLDDIISELLKSDGIPRLDPAKKSDFILLPGKEHPGYAYPDILVRKKLILFNVDWDNANAELSKRNSFMINLRQYVDFLLYLKEGDVRDSFGNKLSKDEADKILGSILVGNPWHAEHIDAKFEEVQGKLCISRNQQGYAPATLCLLLDYLAGKRRDIYFDHWVVNATPQGLPPEICVHGGMQYDPPMNGKVTRFIADGNELYLNCRGDSYNRHMHLGVRECKLAGSAA